MLEFPIIVHTNERSDATINIGVIFSSFLFYIGLIYFVLNRVVLCSYESFLFHIFNKVFFVQKVIVLNIFSKL